jgi:hypothetical protein
MSSCNRILVLLFPPTGFADTLNPVARSLFTGLGKARGIANDG